MAVDVQEELVVEIARELQFEGTYVRLVGSIPQQRVVDIRWAAKRAGRMIGQHVRTSVTHISERPYSDVVVAVSVDPRSPSV